MKNKLTAHTDHGYLFSSPLHKRPDNLNHHLRKQFRKKIKS